MEEAFPGKIWHSNRRQFGFQLLACAKERWDSTLKGRQAMNTPFHKGVAIQLQVSEPYLNLL